ncbi:MAG: hypothetical protein H8E19_01335 [Deltaproteobacteria bacterium]|uniref:Uncharacterized protein n=1 Tax=Candidatus Desulfacyla euxinica TaxID=2841693 RepID=A0A8J6T6M6_9DELT|nr:hypothetical protein [Candidatus Desulfacyla euxinica]MBL7218225.1 hypothetical protein [Desulfobacteraceae bacterium]
MKKVKALIIGIFLVVFSGFFSGCVTDMATLKIEKSLPQNKLAYYNDSFDKLREDLWDKSTPAFKQHLPNFKLADMNFEDGQLKVVTKTGYFISGGLVSRYALRGDFDIQVDCYIDFLAGIYDMDQFVWFVVSERGVAYRASHGVSIAVNKKGGRDASFIVSLYREMGKIHRGNLLEIDNFHGTFRIIRIGNKISTLYKYKEKTGWKKMDTFQSTTKDVMLSFGLSNFIPARTSITARSSITTTFDNFRINAAEAIIEEEI